MHAPRASWSRAASTALKQADGSLFWWSIGIVVLFGMSVFSWFFCIYVFNHPEKPFSYHLLARFQKLENLKAVTEKDAPAGKTHNPRDLNETFYTFTEENFSQKNSELRRGYITNYRNDRAIFVKGRFRIISARPLNHGDFFTEGLVARAVALAEGEHEFRNVVLEYILPGKPTPGAMFQVGDIVEIDMSKKKRRTFTSIVNVAREGEDRLVISAVPLIYGKFEIDSARGLAIDCKPPPSINIQGPWPVTEDTVGVSAAAATTAAR